MLASLTRYVASQLDMLSVTARYIASWQFDMFAFSKRDYKKESDYERFHIC